MKPGHRQIGETCYLKGAQDASCRLFGCEAAYMQVLVLSLPEAPRVGFCKLHARQFANGELHIAGVAGKPVTIPG